MGKKTAVAHGSDFLDVLMVVPDELQMGRQCPQNPSSLEMIQHQSSIRAACIRFDIGINLLRNSLKIGGFQGTLGANDQNPVRAQLILVPPWSLPRFAYWELRPMLEPTAGKSRAPQAVHDRRAAAHDVPDQTRPVVFNHQLPQDPGRSRSDKVRPTNWRNCFPRQMFG